METLTLFEFLKAIRENDLLMFLICFVGFVYFFVRFTIEIGKLREKYKDDEG